LRLILFITRRMRRIYKTLQLGDLYVRCAARKLSLGHDFSYLRRMTALVSKQLVIVKSCPTRKRLTTGPRWSVKNSRLVSAPLIACEYNDPRFVSLAWIERFGNKRGIRVRSWNGVLLNSKYEVRNEARKDEFIFHDVE